MSHPKKRSGARLGQHFLKTTSYARLLAQSARIVPGDDVLEIGPGKGMLTKELLACGARVIAVEKDEALVEVLRARFPEEIARGDLRIIPGDVRDFNPTAHGLVDYTLAANIPYYITGEILRQFLSTATQPRTMALLIQKEVAKRITSSKESILSLSVKAYGVPKIAATVNRKHFSPPPNVDSAILVVEHISKSFFDTITEDDFFTLVRAGFASKRKKLSNNLGVVYGKERAVATLESCSISSAARAETVPLSGWKRLTETLPTRSDHDH